MASNMNREHAVMCRAIIVSNNSRDLKLQHVIKITNTSSRVHGTALMNNLFSLAPNRVSIMVSPQHILVETKQ